MTLHPSRISFLNVLAICAAASFTPQPLQQPPCSYQEFPDYAGKPTLQWQAPVGTVLSGHTTLDFDGDSQPDVMTVRATVERDWAINPVTGHRSDSLFCWFHTRLDVRDTANRSVYRDEWSIKFQDMPALAANHGASGPEDYFSRFGNLQGMFRTGIDTEPSEKARIDSEAVAWSLRAQGIAGTGPSAVIAELRRQRVIREFIYRADWREDLRVVAYVPSLRRGVAIQIGY
jgi:hypothetical protein